MGSSDAHRRLAFAAALGALAAGAAAISLLSHPEPSATPTRRPWRAAPSQSAAAEDRSATSAASLAATRFGVAYLRYEEGVFGPAVRRSIRRFSTREFGSQLLRAPVRVPAGSRPARQWVARVGAVRVGLFDGHPALVAILVIAAADGGHLLRVTLSEEGSRWLVAGIGPP